MAEGGQTVLLLAFDDTLARRVVVALGDLGVQFSRTPAEASISDASRTHRGDLIILHYAGDRTALERLVRRPGVAGPDVGSAAVLVLCESRWFHHVQPLIGHGIRGATLLEESDAQLRAAACTLLGPAPRSRMRLPIEFAIEGGGDEEACSCTTENISATGMLVRCRGPIPIGATVRFEMSVPGDPEPVRGSADVVRRADPERERVHGLGARLATISPSDRDRLEALLSSG